MPVSDQLVLAELKSVKPCSWDDLLVGRDRPPGWAGRSCRREHNRPRNTRGRNETGRGRPAEQVGRGPSGRRAQAPRVPPTSRDGFYRGGRSAGACGGAGGLDTRARGGRGLLMRRRVLPTGSAHCPVSKAWCERATRMYTLWRTMCRTRATPPPQDSEHVLAPKAEVHPRDDNHAAVADHAAHDLLSKKLRFVMPRTRTSYGSRSSRRHRAPDGRARIRPIGRLIVI